ncbi:MAG: PAS domain S-box protein [candidate division Zixibacteria bacterium]|nr:PAS domain S-box protein [candidate division Zixibacteria bacterium]
MKEERQGTVEAPPPDAELVHFKESFETFNTIINNLQRQYLTLEKEYARQETRLEEINHQLRRTIAANQATTVFLNSILTALSSGVVAVNREGIISHFNPAAERITGMGAARALGRRYDEVISAKRGGRFSALDTVLSGGEFESEEKVIINNNGEDIPVSVSTALLHDPEAGPLGAVEIFFDLTKIKRLEEEILRIKTLAALGEMAATVAHEVRNPLGGIGGFAALLRRELAEDEAKTRLVDKIIAGVNTLNLTVTALLDYTRREQLNLRPIPLGRLIEESVEYERADQGASAVNVELAVDIADGNLPVTCDAHLMRQVLLNLLRNGREAMPDGGRITIRAGATPAGGDGGSGGVFIEVADTGHGIAPDIRDRIFQPFFSTRHKHNGSGLGLATVWKTIQAHGGEITVSSEVDNGTVFRIVLPGSGNSEVGAV